MMQKFLLVLLACCAMIKASTQSLPMSIGSTFPDTAFTLTDAKSGSTLNLKQLRKKLIIFDFWSIWCGACIAAMPKLSNLQQQFGKEIQIVLVTRNSPGEVNALFSRIKTRRPDLPMITSDTILHMMFPHDGEPHHVWLDSALNVQYITSGYNATVSHIQQFLDHQSPRLSLKENLPDFDPSRSLYLETTKLPNMPKSYSVFLKGLHDKTSMNYMSFEKDSFGNTVGFTAVTRSVIELFGMAYNRELYGGEVRLINSEKNSRMLFPKALEIPQDSDAMDQWQNDNIFSYELHMDQPKAGEFFKVMREDLNRYLPYTATFKTKEVNCLVLIRTGQQQLATTQPQTSSKVEQRIDKFEMINAPIDCLIKSLSGLNDFYTLPVLDETGVKYNVDLSITPKLYDLKLVNQNLVKYGLQFTEKKRLCRMLILTKKP